MCDLLISFQKGMRTSQSQDKIMTFNVIQEAVLYIQDKVQKSSKILEIILLRKTHH